MPCIDLTWIEPNFIKSTDVFCNPNQEMPKSTVPVTSEPELDAVVIENVTLVFQKITHTPNK